MAEQAETFYEWTCQWLERNEQAQARRERAQLDTIARHELNELIDEQRMRDQAADEAYWERMAELEEERRQDQ